MAYLGQNIQRLRRKQRISQGELAEQLANEHIMHVIENLKKQGFK